MDLKVICLETEAYYKLLQGVIDLVKDQDQQEELWVDTETAMSILKISSKTTLQKFRDEQKIIFSQISRKVILYSRESLYQFLNDKIVTY